MWRHRAVILIVLIGPSVMVPRWARAQHGPGHGMGAGMMGMGHDSATMALVRSSHRLVMNHDRIRRTVTNLPNGVRTVTESDDPGIATLIREHVDLSLRRVAKGDDPGLPMETPALRSIFRYHDRIHTSTQTTPTGVVVVQTSNDSSAVVELQKHAAEVSELVAGGMAALHASMMKNGGMGMGRGMGRGMGMGIGMGMGGARGAVTSDTGLAHRDHAAHTARAGGSDSAFVALQQRGRRAMGVDQYTSTHRFDASPDGGRIELQRDVDDSAGVAQIRTHLRDIVRAFAAGDFSTPAFVHMQEVPGVSVMAAKRASITYTYRALPRGGEVRIRTNDAEALTAIHDFLRFQRQDHRAP